MDISKIFPLEYIQNGETLILEDFTPLNTQILIVPLQDDVVSSGGIIMPVGVDKLKSNVQGMVVRVSAKEKDNVKPGDKIFYQKMGELTLPLNFKNKDVKLMLIRSEWIVGKIEQ